VSRGDGTTVVAGPSVPEGGATPAFLSGAAASTGEIATSKMTTTIEISGAPGVNGTMTMEGQFDRANNRASMTMDYGDLAPAMGDGTMTTIVDGTDVYLSGPMLGLLGVDEEWAKIDAGQLGELGGSSAGGMVPDGPSSFLDLLRSTGKVDTVGPEDVRGVPTTHYRATLDFGSLADRVPAKARKRLDEMLGGYGLSLDDYPSMPADAWIDADGHVRRLRLLLDFGKMTGPDVGLDGVTMTETVELYDFGKPVTIEVPDPADVGTLDPSKLLGGD
jgi:hypothetical protein